MNKLTDNHVAAQDAAMSAARDTPAHMARVCSCEVVGERLETTGCPRHGLVRDALIGDDELRERR